MARISV